MNTLVANRIRVEFFGVPRIHTGVAETFVDVEDCEILLGELLKALTARFPKFGRECVILKDEDCVMLQKSLTANIDGQRFVRDCRTEIRQGQTLLIMSADSGG